MVLFFCISIFGCEEETPPPFSKEKIRKILTQVHLTDATVTSLLGEQKDSMSKVYLAQVKKINDITDEDIESIFDYLKNHPEFAEEIYGKMILEVTEMQRTDSKGGSKKNGPK